MLMKPLLAAVAGVLLLAGCGDETSPAGPAPAPRSGVVGQVHLGPQCAVEQVDEPCDDRPAQGVLVTVAAQLPGDSYAAGASVAKGRTDADGGFRIAVEPGAYVVTADAGMSCELMDARVHPNRYTPVIVTCDTGIR
jgi:hypothetical protein